MHTRSLFATMIMEMREPQPLAYQKIYKLFQTLTCIQRRAGRVGLLDGF